MAVLRKEKRITLCIWNKVKSRSVHLNCNHELMNGQSVAGGRDFLLDDCPCLTLYQSYGPWGEAAPVSRSL